MLSPFVILFSSFISIFVNTNVFFGWLQYFANVQFKFALLDNNLRKLSFCLNCKLAIRFTHVNVLRANSFSSRV